VENLIGGSSPDTLIGSALANRITGGLGPIACAGSAATTR
jgi:hypothetical protein